MIDVRFPNGVTLTRFLDAEYCASSREERLWAYVRLATTPRPERAAAAGVVAAELQAARSARATRWLWTPARVRAAALEYAVREHPGRDETMRAASGAADAANGMLNGTSNGRARPEASSAALAATLTQAGWHGSGELVSGDLARVAVPTAHEPHAVVFRGGKRRRAAAGASADGASTAAGGVGRSDAGQTLARPAWRTLVALAHETGEPLLDVRNAALRGALGRFRCVTAERDGWALDGSIGDGSAITARVGEHVHAVDEEVGAAALLAASLLAVAPSDAELDAALPSYARRMVAAREGWPVEDTVTLVDVESEPGMNTPGARMAARRGAGLVRDRSGRVFTRYSALRRSARELLDVALAERPDLAAYRALDPRYWVMQREALQRLNGARWITLRRHTVQVAVGGGGIKHNVWVHLPPHIEARLRLRPLADALAEWNATFRTPPEATSDVSVGVSSAVSTEAPIRLARPPVPLEACMSRTAIFAHLRAHGASISYQTYLKAVRRGAITELVGTPAPGGEVSAHALVPEAIRHAPTRAAVLRWLAGELPI